MPRQRKFRPKQWSQRRQSDRWIIQCHSCNLRANRATLLRGSMIREMMIPIATAVYDNAIWRSRRLCLGGVSDNRKYITEGNLCFHRGYCIGHAPAPFDVCRVSILCCCSLTRIHNGLILVVWVRKVFFIIHVIKSVIQNRALHFKRIISWVGKRSGQVLA